LSEPLVERMREFTTTIFAEMTALATRTGAINLGQGFPDTEGPAALLETAAKAIATGGANQYPPGPGIPELRSAVAEQRKARYGLDYDPESEVLVTVGATEGIASSVLALAEAGDEVIVFEPYYDSYPAVIAMAGAVRRTVTLRPDGDRFTFDPAELRAAAGPRTKLIIINSPHNPTGTVFSAEELEEIAAVCREHDIIAITDEVYEYLTFDGAKHIPLATLPGMRERTLGISSAGKTFSVTGWKTGWVTGPAPLVAAARAVKQFLTFTVSGAYQQAVAHALRTEQDWIAANRATLEAQRDVLMTGLTDAGFRVYRPQGTYFVQADVPPGFADGMDLCRALPERAGVVAVPTQVFYDDEAAGMGFVRFAFCKVEPVLRDAVHSLAKLR